LRRTAIRQRTFVEVVLAAVDSRTGKPGDGAHDGEAAVAGSLHLVGSEQSLPALVELAAQRFPAQSDAVAVDHAQRIQLFAPRENPPSRSVARFTYR
jgi:hypothetical protein